MTQRTYKMVRTPPGQKGTTISDFVDGMQPVGILHLSDSTAPEDLFAVTTTLQRVLQQGREDRSAEILGDDGLWRATEELDKHELAALHPSGLSCSCGKYHDPDASDERYRRHVAYEVLQAAARLP